MSKNLIFFKTYWSMTQSLLHQNWCAKRSQLHQFRCGEKDNYCYLSSRLPSWGCFINTFVIHWLINWLSQWSFCSESSRHCLTQTIRAGELKFWEKVHSHHVLHVTCHMSGVRCQESGVRCQVYIYVYIYIFFFVGQSIEASRGRICYQRGLPCLVFSYY